MGSFFGNVHVRIGEGDPFSIAEERVRAAIGNAYSESEAKRPPDRTVLLARRGDARWVSVFDEDADALDPAAIQQVGSALGVADDVAIGAIVADSDTLELSLFARGERVDRVRFDPAKSRRPRVRQKEWQSAVGVDVTARLLASLRRQTAFAEDPVESLGAAFGWGDLACGGYQHRDEIKDAAEVRELRFWLPDSARFYTIVEGLPDLWTNSEDKGSIGAAAGERFDLNLTLYNHGGKSKGLEVILPWSAEHARILAIERIRIHVGDGIGDFEMKPEVVAHEDKMMLRARFAELPLEPYPEWGDGLTPAQLTKLNAVLQRARLWASAHGTAVAPGRVEVTVLFTPDENRRAGVTGRIFEITVAR